MRRGRTRSPWLDHLAADGGEVVEQRRIGRTLTQDVLDRGAARLLRSIERHELGHGPAVDVDPHPLTGHDAPEHPAVA